jgi:hypothetical protein
VLPCGAEHGDNHAGAFFGKFNVGAPVGIIQPVEDHNNDDFSKLLTYKFIENFSLVR